MFIWGQSTNQKNSQVSLQTVLRLYHESPADYTVNLKLGWLYLNNGKYTNSLFHYKNAVSIEKKSIEAQLGLCLTHTAMHSYQELEALAKEILRKDKHNFNASLYLVEAQIQQKKYEQAALQLNKLQSFYPANQTVLNKLLTLYKLQGRNADLTKVQKQLSLLNL